jgi:hypothetical protein
LDKHGKDGKVRPTREECSREALGILLRWWRNHGSGRGRVSADEGTGDGDAGADTAADRDE